MSSLLSALRSSIDLTHPVSDGLTMNWPGDTPFKLSIVHRGDVAEGAEDEAGGAEAASSYHYELNDFTQCEHAGTHMDAPAHFGRGRWRLGDIPHDRLSGPAVKIDISRKCRDNSDAQLEMGDVQEFERVHGAIAAGSIVVMETGWSRFYEDRAKFLGIADEFLGKSDEEAENLHFPGVDPEAAKFLVEERKIIGLCVDTASIDRGQSKDYATHKVICGANVWAVESLANVDKLPPKDFILLTLPHKIKEGSGAPTRVIAFPISQEVASS